MGNVTDFSNFGPNSGYIEELYQLYLIDPSLVGDSWSRYFSSLGSQPTNGHAHAAVAVASAPQTSSASSSLELVSAYRRLGHLGAKINPLAKGFFPGPGVMEFEQPEVSKTDTELLARLQQTYCGPIGFEIEHVYSVAEKEWLRNKAENDFPRRGSVAASEKKAFFDKVVAAEILEEELHKTYVGVTRFSIQGSESLMPLLDMLVEVCAADGAEELIFGMAHRGRLAVLANTIHKPIQSIIREFEDKTLFAGAGSGDVKYHMDYSSMHQTRAGRSVRVSLAPNPSHLEFVNPVVMGMARAKQDLNFARNRKAVVPVLMHGDAAFIGQGIVAESLNLCRIPGHACGGTIHVVINNQVGFTTGSEEARSSTYCSDIGRAFGMPVFHVNGDDVEAVTWAAKTAAEYRQKFGMDVILDLYCYRRWGHNEGDDPIFTNPVLYKEIEEKQKISEIYGEKLKAAGLLQDSDVATLTEQVRSEVKAAVTAIKAAPATSPASSLHGKIHFPDPETAVSADKLKEVAQSLINYPEGFVPNPKLARLIEKRVETLNAGEGIEWGFAEALAYGSLVQDGLNIRLVGQDACRGTFSHRHLGITDFDSGKRFYPLAELAKTLGSGGFEVINSVLSENAVMGYEFGYSTVQRSGLTLWEGQFGDFVNGAQVIIDQFLASAEQKWGQYSGLVLLLPHGYEGRGPEHSSARLERFLQGAADNNYTVCYPSSAVQYFHMLRRQAKSELQRPLIVMTPKSLLRLPAAGSKVEEFTDAGFKQVLADRFGAASEIERVIFLTGKIYYDVRAAIPAEELAGTQIVRLEQLYPFPEEMFKLAMDGLDPKQILWVQEEPQNMGAWPYVHAELLNRIGEEPEFAGRLASGSTATGSGKYHAAEQKGIIEKVRAWIKGN